MGIERFILSDNNTEWPMSRKNKTRLREEKIVKRGMNGQERKERSVGKDGWRRSTVGGKRMAYRRNITREGH